MYAKLFLPLILLCFLGCEETFQIKILVPKFDRAFQWNLPSFTNLVDSEELFSESTDVKLHSTQMDDEGNFYIYGDFSGVLAGVPSLDRDLFLLKLNTKGEKVWLRHLSSGFANITNSSGTEKAEGDMVWDARTKTFYFTATTTSSFIENNSSGLDDIVVGRFSKNGNILWLRHYGEETENNFSDPTKDFAQADAPGSINFTPTGELLITFQTTGSLFDINAGADDGTSDVGVIKINHANGDILQGMQLGVNTLFAFDSSADASGSEGVTQGRAAMDGANLVVAMRTRSSLVDNHIGSNSDAAYMVLNANLEITELKQIGGNLYADWVNKGNYLGSTSSDDQFRSVVVLAPRHYLFYGKTAGSLGEEKLGTATASDLFFAIFKDGELINLKQYGSITSPLSINGEEPRHMVRDSVGNIYCVGHSSSELFDQTGNKLKPFIFKIDSEANLISGKQFGTTTTMNMEITNSYNLVSPGSFVIHEGKIVLGGYNSVSGSSSGPSNPFIWSLEL